VPSNSDNAKVDASEATEREIDIAVRDIVVKAFDRATEVLRAEPTSTRAPAYCSRRKR
jgi:hypothetical protein